MNKFKLIVSALAICASSLILTSCNDDEQTTIYTAEVTVRPNTDGSFVLQLDKNTVLQPINVSKSPYGQKEVRALVNFIKEEDKSRSNVENITLCWIDSIRTKMPVQTLGFNEDIKKYGDDEIEIVKDWTTVAEDGYLTLRIRTLWGFRNVVHNINLVKGVNPNDPLEFELRHNANNDYADVWGDALIAFNLNDIPEIQRNNVKITVKWKSFTGEKSTVFDLQVRKEEKSPSDLPTIVGGDLLD